MLPSDVAGLLLPKLSTKNNRPNNLPVGTDISGKAFVFVVNSEEEKLLLPKTGDGIGLSKFKGSIIKLLTFHSNIHTIAKSIK